MNVSSGLAGRKWLAMHDPMAVAFDLRLPIPKRDKWRDQFYKGRRWGWTRQRRTNPEHLGQPVYRWWKPRGWQFAAGGRVFGLYNFGTIWHVEPGGRDSGEVCKHHRQKADGTRSWNSRWKWHVWHWRIQIAPVDNIRRYLLRRCGECGRRFPYKYAPISHQWDSPKLHWWSIDRHAYHHECSSLISLRRDKEQAHDAIRFLVGALRVSRDQSEAEFVASLPSITREDMRFLVWRIERALGWEYDTELDATVKRRGGEGSDQREVIDTVTREMRSVVQ